MTASTTDTRSWTRAVWSSTMRGHLKIVALALAELCGPDRQSCTASLSEIVALVNMGQRTTIEALADLEQRGWVEVEDGEDDYADTYTLVVGR